MSKHTSPTHHILQAAVIGAPIQHSKSPLIHNHFIQQHGLHAIYTAIHIKNTTELAAWMPRLRSPEWAGINVTIPYKEAVMPYLDHCDDSVRAIGACNTVINQGGKLYGLNTDPAGFAQPLLQKSIESVLILGNGGAAKAVLYQCAKMGIPKITLMARHLASSSTMVASLEDTFNMTIHQCSFNQLGQHAVVAHQLVVNTTPIGMSPKDPVFPGIGAMGPGQLFYDLIYAPWETPMLALARSKGAEGINGAWMLAGQGALAFEALFHQPADAATMHGLIQDAAMGCL
jgi:shikimate dehydrogenase